jgi:hypothetical protein
MEAVQKFTSLSKSVLSDEVESLLNLELLVDCSSWGEKAALQLFGVGWETKKTPASIIKVTGTKVGRLKFDLHFPELNTEYVGFNWEYITKYITSPLPERFSLMAENISTGRQKRAGPKPNIHQKAPPEKKKVQIVGKFNEEAYVHKLINIEVRLMIASCCIDSYSEIAASAAFPSTAFEDYDTSDTENDTHFVLQSDPAEKLMQGESAVEFAPENVVQHMY